VKTDPRALARDFVTYCDGVEEGGSVDYARRGRVVADELRRALDELEAERSARRALQRRCDAQQEILGRRVAEALELENRRRRQPPRARAAPLDLTVPPEIRDLAR
jgi:hypothetical protein